jgi:hypothetical protein
VIAVGPNGTLVYGGPIGWLAQPLPTKANLRAVWGLADDNIWAVGDGGTTLRFNGVSWQLEPTDVSFSLRGVWGQVADEIYAVGDGGILRWNGVKWSKDGVPHAEGLTSLSGNAAGLALATGSDGRVLQHQNGAWEATFAKQDGTALVGSHVSATGRMFVITQAGEVLEKTPSGWETFALPAGFSARTVWSASDDELWFGGDGGALYEWDGANFIDHSLPDSDVDVRAIAGAPESAFRVAVGAFAVRLGPFLDFPSVQEPAAGAELGSALGWKPPQPGPNYHALALVDAFGKVFWQLIVKGDVTYVELPDFALLANIPLWPEGAVRLALTHVLSAPNDPFDISGFTTFDFSLYSRLSWSGIQVNFQ